MIYILDKTPDYIAIFKHKNTNKPSVLNHSYFILEENIGEFLYEMYEKDITGYRVLVYL